jgi:hypothetical protein
LAGPRFGCPTLAPAVAVPADLQGQSIPLLL